MWDFYADLAEQRLQELYEDAATRRRIPSVPRPRSAPRVVLGRALVRWGERLAAPVAGPVPHA